MILASQSIIILFVLPGVFYDACLSHIKDRAAVNGCFGEGASYNFIELPKVQQIFYTMNIQLPRCLKKICHSNKKVIKLHFEWQWRRERAHYHNPINLITYPVSTSFLNFLKVFASKISMKMHHI